VHTTEKKEEDLMSETPSANGTETWKKFLRRHRKMFVLFVVGAILVSVGAILVFLWFVGIAQSTGIVPTTLGLWTLGNLVSFLLNLIFWEVLLIGIPVIFVAAAVWLWWKRLPLEERKEYRYFGNRSRSTSGSVRVA
jgi:fatty acid desaturase